MNIKKNIDFNLIKVLAIFYTIVVSLTFSKWYYFYYFKSNTLSDKPDFSFSRFIFGAFILDWIFVMLFMVVISIIVKILFEKINTKPFIFIHFILSFFLSWFIYFWASMTMYLVGLTSFKEAIKNVSFYHFMKNIDVNFLTYFSMLGIIYAYYYIKKIKKIEIQKTNLKTQLTETKMKVLTEKLHPHFLFNTLNSISSLIDINKKNAQNTIADLSDLLREILELKEDHLITLEQELNLLKKYINIKSIRFYDHLDVKLKIQDNIENALIPSMLIQPILENSFKHGYSYNHVFLEIKLHIYKKGNRLVIEIANNGKTINKPLNNLQKLGIGINNTIDRLEALYKNNYQYIMKNMDSNKGVITKISIPFQVAEAKLHKFNTFSQ